MRLSTKVKPMSLYLTSGVSASSTFSSVNGWPCGMSPSCARGMFVFELVISLRQAWPMLDHAYHGRVPVSRNSPC